MELTSEVPPPESELVASLEQATLMARQLPTTASPTQLLHIYSSLQSAHDHLSSFLSQTLNRPPPPPPAAAADNSFSSAVDGGADEPMQIADGDDEAEENSKTTIESVEERMKDFSIRRKRLKRSLSPSLLAAAEQLHSYDGENNGGGYDPKEVRLRSLDLVFQFHG